MKKIMHVEIDYYELHDGLGLEVQYTEFPGNELTVRLFRNDDQGIEVLHKAPIAESDRVVALGDMLESEDFEKACEAYIQTA